MAVIMYFGFFESIEKYKYQKTRDKQNYRAHPSDGCFFIRVLLYLDTN